MKIQNSDRAWVLAGLTLMALAADVSADSLQTSWLTNYSGQYARIYSNSAAQSSGSSATSWSNGSQTQALPAYVGVQEVDSSSNWIYIRTTGLGIHTMGAWQAGFPNLPVNQKALYRFPRVTSVPSTKTSTGGGVIGYFIDGVSMFNSWDAFYWNGSADVSSTGTNVGYWNRDAYVNEGATFDPAYAHQQNTGTYHYHADPIALRYLVGDHVDYSAATRTYSESTNAVTKHSPLLGWVADGLPVYGPYGYANPTNPASGVRRMISGYVLRNGQYGTDDLSTTKRKTIPAWAVRLFNVSSNQTGPDVSTSYPLGRYMEDNDYLGDHGYTLGVDFDLNEYNCRYCVTPEFPTGTYAYFVSISSNGTPTFPYNIGRGFYGSPTGGSVPLITENVTTNFIGGPNAGSQLATPGLTNNTVTLVWSAAEGGVYQVQSSATLSSWSTNATNIPAVKNTGTFSGTNAGATAFFRVARTSLANYDPATSSSYGITSVSPTNASAGSTFTLTINISSSVNPPPAMAPINSVMLGNIAGTGSLHVSSNQVTSSFTIPGGTSGPQNVILTFPGPPGNTSNTVTYYLLNGVNIN